MSKKSYGIIKRSVGTEKIPLSGMAECKDELNIGDIVGVVIYDRNKKHVEFECHCYFICDGHENEQSNCHSYKYPKVMGSYTRKEEHFFRVTGFCNKANSKFSVEPVFIDGKVIIKPIDESFSKDFPIPGSLLTKFYLLRYYLNEQKLDYKEYDYLNLDDFVRKYENPNFVPKEVISYRKYQEERKRTGIISVTNDKIVIPYDDYKTTIFDLDWDKEVERFKKFHELLDMHPELKIDREKIGTYQQVVDNMDKLHAEADNLKCKDQICSIDFSYNTCVSLDKPQIKHDITHIKYSEITRVYRRDPTYYCHKVNTVCNCGGIILDEEIRNHLDKNNIVRACVGKVDEKLYPNSIYCRILQKLSQYKLLAVIENHYSDNYEDTIIVIDSRCISEIPVNWEGNEALLVFNRDSGPGYFITGGGAISSDDKQFYEINYNDVEFK